MTKRAAPRYIPSYPLFGILNKDGQFWTHETFLSEEQARRHLEGYWGVGGYRKRDFAIIPIRLTITDAREATP